MASWKRGRRTFNYIDQVLFFEVIIVSCLLQKILIMNNQWFNTSEVLELVLGGPPDVNDSDDIVKTVTHSDDRRKRGC